MFGPGTINPVASRFERGAGGDTLPVPFLFLRISSRRLFKVVAARRSGFEFEHSNRVQRGLPASIKR